MLSQFPARDLDEPVTKEFVALTAADLRVEMSTLRSEVQAEFASVRADIASLRVELAELRVLIASQTERLMTRMQIVAAIGFAFLAVLTVVAR